MTTDQYRAALERLGLSQGEAAKFLGISIRSSHGYANGEPIPRTVSHCLQMLLLLGPKSRKALIENELNRPSA